MARTKTVFPRDELARVWLAQTQASGKAANKAKMFFEGDTIYSYGRHFPIAKLIDAPNGERVCLFTTQTRSMSTRRHVSSVRREIRGFSGRVIECYEPGAAHSQNINRFKGRADGLIASHAKARKPCEGAQAGAVCRRDIPSLCRLPRLLRGILPACPTVGAVAMGYRAGRTAQGRALGVSRRAAQIDRNPNVKGSKMDKLKTPAPQYYTGTVKYAKLRSTTHKDLDEAGQFLLRQVCKREAIEGALKNAYMRRTYSGDYLTRDMKKRQMYLADFDQLGARWVKDASDVVSMGHTGWYTDDGSELLHGVVLCFTRHGSGGMDGNDNFDETKPKGRVIYMAGTRHSDWDGVTLDLDTTDCAVTAARWADSMAEREAESCREENEEYRREQDAEELRDQIKAARTACLKLLRDMRPIRKGMGRFPESVCQALRDQVQDYCETIAGCRRELKELT